jgi:hypothetical protein
MHHYYYSPHTLEIINTTTPSDWMATTEVEPPVIDPTTQSCIFQGGAWVVADVVPPAPPVPEVVSMRQARIALLAAGHLAAVTAAIAAMPSIEGDVARIEWEYAQDVRRDSPLIGALAPVLGLSQEQLDGLFVQASKL